MLSGPKVDVYVGTERKHYNLPKLLLCHYSKFLDRCFNGPFLEGETQRLSLPKDKVPHFEVLLGYMLYGKVPDPQEFESACGGSVKDHIGFLEYADKYDLGVVSAVIFEPLKERLHLLATNCWAQGSAPEIESMIVDYIEAIFRFTPDGSPLRSLITRAALLVPIEAWSV